MLESVIFMAIAPVSSVNVVVTKAVENKKVSTPIAAEKPEVQQLVAEKGALKSYFLGGQAATVAFGGFGVSTGGFITKKMDDVPCCCCGGRMVREPTKWKIKQENLQVSEGLSWQTKSKLTKTSSGLLKELL